MTVEEKYNFLLSYLEVQDIDLWEQDALIGLKSKIYFQFSVGETFEDIDKAVEAAYTQERTECLKQD